MKNYELTYLVSSELPEEEVKSLQAKIASFVQEEGGFLVEEGMFLRRKLAYPIKKQSQAYLVIFVFQLDPQKLANLEKKLKAESQILRYLLLIKLPQRPRKIRAFIRKPVEEKPEKEKKVELKEIEKKLEEILKEE
ncbi:MAG: 30S ribosomal protein S6 [Candidatus Pacebacteria bacterium]|nr:30S ribosomal protein S6 [Candidatus Paceibacterota bacterium]